MVRVGLIVLVIAVFGLSFGSSECHWEENMLATGANPKSACKWHFELCKCRCGDLENTRPCEKKCKFKFEQVSKRLPSTT
jgi:hypothetical protein